MLITPPLALVAGKAHILGVAPAGYRQRVGHGRADFGHRCDLETVKVVTVGAAGTTSGRAKPMHGVAIFGRPIQTRCAAFVFWSGSI